MIEFRWLRFHSNSNDGTHPTAMLDNATGYVRVLQYRERSSEQNRPPGFTDWKDIPIVDA